MISKNCLICGKDFTSFLASKRKYCSKKCYHISAIEIMKNNTNGFKVGHTPWCKGKKTGITPWLGKKRSSETNRKISETLFQKYTGENSFLWKGENIGYQRLHVWIGKHLGKPETCEHCGKNGLKGWQIHWANKDHEYKRNLKDWLRLCIICHNKYDRNHNLLGKGILRFNS